MKLILIYFDLLAKGFLLKMFITLFFISILCKFLTKSNLEYEPFSPTGIENRQRIYTYPKRDINDPKSVYNNALGWETNRKMY